MTSPPLVVTSITKRYGRRAVLADQSLRVDPGEAVVLRGPNGAGKSTVLGCVVGTVIPDEGTVAIDGHDLTTAPLAARAALRYLPQEPEVPPGLSGTELLDFFAQVHDDPGGAQRAATVLDFGDALGRLASTYSVGMRRQLMFAGLLPGRARLWVLDEPFAGVDGPGRAKIRDVLRRALDDGAGVLLAAHDRDADDVQPLSPRVVVIEPAAEASSDGSSGSDRAPTE